MKPAKRRIEVTELTNIDRIWELYQDLQSSLSLFDPGKSIDLVVMLHNELCNLSNGTTQDLHLMMDFETNILPSCIREICDMNEKAKNFILGNLI